MKPIHALAIAAALAVAVVIGLSAVTKTTRLGASARHASSASIAARTRQLDAFEASLHKALKSKPPALPKLPAGGAAAGAGAPRIVYHRPPPVIIHKHRPGGEGHESEQGSDD